jgi:hypothetical protein
LHTVNKIKYIVQIFALCGIGMSYNILVKTGNQPGAGTDANVYIILYGESEDTGKVQLATSRTNKNKFESNNTDEFTVEAVDIGPIKKIKISHDNKGGFAGWFLEYIIVDTPLLGTRQVFSCNRWLDKGKDDGAIERELYPAPNAEQKYQPYIRYEVTTYTSDVQGAGTNANVYVSIYGQLGHTGELPLIDTTKHKRKDCFKRKSVDICIVEGPDIGEYIKKIRIGHDGTGFGAGWHLAKVEVRQLEKHGDSQHSRIFSFPCGRWLARDEDDHEIVRELVPAMETVVKEDADLGQLKVHSVKRGGTLSVKQYVVHVFTGNVNGAGTDANVYLTIFGEMGDSGERKLLKSETHQNKFERNHEDIFNIEAANLGQLQRVKVRHDNSLISPDWFLDKIVIREVSEVGQEVEYEYTFYCERWLAKNKEDGKIERELLESNYLQTINLKTTAETTQPEAKTRQEIKALARKKEEEGTTKSPTIPYSIQILTAADSDAGTNANAFIRLIGQQMSTERINLELQSANRYEPGKTQIFAIEAIDVGKIERLEIGHDGLSKESGWLVKTIEVNVPTQGQKYCFVCGKWLAKGREDGKTVRELRPFNTQSYSPLVPYEVTVVTGNQQDAGTDAGIYMIVYGLDGKTLEVALEKQSVQFERGRTDKIKLEFEDVGSLRKIRVWHDGKGQRPSWFLNTIILKNLKNDKEWTFPCNNWLSKTRAEDKLTVRDLPAVFDGKLTVEDTSYKIKVETGDKRGAGTDANVFVTLFGENGDSGEIQLTKSLTHRNKFERRQTDIFHYENLLSLGELTKLRIWHDNSGLGASWFLDSVSVTDEVTEEAYHFNCQRWLSTDEDDKSTVRELTCVASWLHEESAVTPYEITVTTSDKRGSGTPHDLGLTIIGERGRSKEFQTKNRLGNQILFQRGQTDVLQFACQPLGRLNEIEIRLFDRTGKILQSSEATSKDNSWHLHEITVTDIKTGDR